MATCANQDIELFYNYFKEDVYCENFHEHRIFNFRLDSFDENGQCLLTKGQKEMYRFFCYCKRQIFFFNFETIDTGYVKQLKTNRRRFFELLEIMKK